MINLQTKIDYALTSEGRVFARELNLTGGSLKKIISASGDTRPGADNDEAVLGAIDDLARTQLFKVVGSNLVRYSTLPGITADPLELKTGQLISIYVNTANPLPDSISVATVPYSVKILGAAFSTIAAPVEAILTAVVDTATSTIKVVNTGDQSTAGGAVSFGQIVLVDNANYVAPVNVSIDNNNTLLLVEQSITTGAPKTININTTLVEGSFIVIENQGINDITDTMIVTSSPIKGIGTSIHLNTVAFRFKLFVENGELKSELLTVGSGTGGSAGVSGPTAAADVTYDNLGSTLTSTNVNAALNELDSGLATEISDRNTSEIAINNRIDTANSTILTQGNAITTLENDVSKLSPVGITHVTDGGLGALSIVKGGRLYSSVTINTALDQYTAGRGPRAQLNAGLEWMSEVVFPNEDQTVNHIIQIGNHNIDVMYALFDNGNLYTWGSNSAGQCGLGHTSIATFPTLSKTGIVKVYSDPSNNITNSGSRLVILDSNGVLYGTGYNGFGQLGLGTTTNASTWTVIPGVTAGTIKSVWNKGDAYGCLVVQLLDDTILVAGYNGHGQLGLGDTVNRNVLTDVTSIWGPGAISNVGGFYGFMNSVNTAVSNTTITMLFTGGVVKTCGHNVYGQLGNNSTVNSSVPVALTIPPITKLQATGLSIFALSTTGDLFSWGYGADTLLGLGATTNTLVPTLITTGVADIYSENASRFYSSYAVNFFFKKIDGSLWSTGTSTYGGRGIGTNAVELSPTQVRLPKDEVVNTIGSIAPSTTSGLSFIAIMNSGNIFVWGDGTSHSIGIADVPRNIWTPTSFKFNNIKG